MAGQRFDECRGLDEVAEPLRNEPADIRSCRLQLLLQLFSPVHHRNHVLEIMVVEVAGAPVRECLQLRGAEAGSGAP